MKISSQVIDNKLLKAIESQGWSPRPTAFFVELELAALPILFHAFN